MTISVIKTAMGTFCLINICLSLSDDANKVKTLNIERR